MARAPWYREDRLADHVHRQLAQAVDDGAELLGHQQLLQRNIRRRYLERIAGQQGLVVAERAGARTVAGDGQHEIAIPVIGTRAFFDMASALMAAWSGFEDPRRQRHVA